MNLRLLGAALALSAVVGVTIPAYAASPVDQAQQQMANGDLKDALATLDGYLKTAPQDADARFTRGIVLTKLDRTDDAIKAFSSLTKDYPQLPEPYNNLAVLYAQKGEYDKARSALEAALATHPSYATASENLGDVYAALAGQAYDRALALDKNNSQVRYKLSLINKLTAPSGATQVATNETAAPKPAEAPAAAPAEKPAPKATQKPAAAPEEKPAPASAPAEASTTSRDAQVAAVLESWAKAWSSQDLDAYLSHYAKDFDPGSGQSLKAWKDEREKRLKAPKYIKVKLSDIQVTTIDATHVRARFRQDYHSNTFSSVVPKGVELEKVGDSWKIARENVR